jgi:Mlc titration factor MtfA (ptsG expression regulator)
MQRPIGYDLEWFASTYPEVRMSHLESRIRQSGDCKEKGYISFEKLQTLLHDAVHKLDVEKARKEISPFVRDRHTLELWSHVFFMDVIQRVIPI